MRSIKEWNVKGRKYTLLHHNMKYQLRIDDLSTTLLIKLGDIDDDIISRIEDTTASTSLSGVLDAAMHSVGQYRSELLDLLLDNNDLYDIVII